MFINKRFHLYLVSLTACKINQPKKNRQLRAENKGHHGKRATFYLPGTCQHITEKNQCVECILSLNYGREGKEASG